MLHNTQERSIPRTYGILDWVCLTFVAIMVSICSSLQMLVFSYKRYAFAEISAAV